MTAKKHKTMKVLILLIPFIIISYLIYSNYLVDREFNYHYNIGGEKNYLSPEDRISEKYNDQRNLAGGLVYFWVHPNSGYQKIKISAKIKTNFPEDGEFFIGIRDKEEWSYKYNQVYTKIGGEDEWIMIETTFDVNEDNIILRNNGQISLIFNTPHLSKEEYKNYTIPIDYINITIYKPGIL